MVDRVKGLPLPPDFSCRQKTVEPSVRGNTGGPKGRRIAVRKQVGDRRREKLSGRCSSRCGEQATANAQTVAIAIRT